ncbi:hypothetical protein SAMN05444387_4604 [Flavobacterium pectinovorum]|uniref:Alpha/beta hydrolase n=1 Tax=Flavobacterium pectinovorum TaxID=29533 RepID=A0ABY1J9N6_9FLAO|nr:hypothetical protein SAMN05444387_4604 [Flavobacterium pectinovorum]
MENEKTNTQNELNSSSSNSKNTIVIVHGAWSSANDWLRYKFQTPYFWRT